MSMQFSDEQIAQYRSAFNLFDQGKQNNLWKISYYYITFGFRIYSVPPPPPRLVSINFLWPPGARAINWGS